MFKIPRISSIEALKSIEPQPIACNNWQKEFPYQPSVRFRMGHTGSHIVVNFQVEEQYTLAVVDKDNGSVWTDSCVELFIALDSEGYYNFECNCTGHLLAAWRKTKPEPHYLNEALMAQIERYPSLGSEPITQERVGENSWELTLKIPCQALFKHSIQSLCGLRARVNLYKCGDNLSKPHFLSWQPIDNPTPNFHLPEFFVDVEFE